MDVITFKQISHNAITHHYIIQTGEKKKQLWLPPSIISSIFITVFVYFPQRGKKVIITAAFRMNEAEPASNLWLTLLRPWFSLPCRGVFPLGNVCFCCMLNKSLCVFVKPACECVTMCACRKPFFLIQQAGNKVLVCQYGAADKHKGQ